MISSFIKRPPITISPNAKLAEVVKVMAENNAGLAVVSEGNKPIGVVSERDVIRALAKGVDLNESVAKVGTFHKLVVVREDEDVRRAVELMRENNIRHVLVVDGDGNLKGVVSIRDLVDDRAILEAWKRTWYPKPEE